MEKKSIECEYRNIVLHIPHSATLFPVDTQISFNSLDREERLLVDYYTDELFAPEQPSDHIISMVFPYCRLYADVERLVNDPLEKVGLGISYRRRIGKTGDYRSFSTMTTAFNLYADFHAKVSKQIVELGQGTLLIDCHSFSALPNLLNSNPPDIDICIGYNDDESCPETMVIDAIAEHFRRRGYKVGINTPFSNSKTFSVPITYHSVMIEVNKRLYMDEQTLGKSEGLERLKHYTHALYDKLLYVSGE